MLWGVGDGHQQLVLQVYVPAMLVDALPVWNSKGRGLMNKTYMVGLQSNQQRQLMMKHQQKGATYLPTYLSTHPPTHLPTYLPNYLPTCLPTYLPTHLPTYN